MSIRKTTNKGTDTNAQTQEQEHEEEEEEEEEEASVFGEPLWMFGLGCVIFGSVLDLISFGFADMSLLAPLGGMYVCMYVCVDEDMYVCIDVCRYV
jgi:hypothetical protein